MPSILFLENIYIIFPIFQQYFITLFGIVLFLYRIERKHEVYEGKMAEDWELNVDL